MPRIRLQLDGVDTELETTAPTAIDALRRDLGLTGTKYVCGAGTCGACVVWVNGVSVASCLLPVEDLDGATVTTVEGIGASGPHPIQRALAACDGLQCGFCTPGFVMEGAAFVDAWRSSHGETRPPRAEVDRALSGHLCRCGAYVGIIGAVQSACEGRFDTGPVRGPRVEAAEKLTGRARYTVDVTLPGMLEGRIVRSPLAHAELIDIDISGATAMPGVEAVITFPPPDGRIRFVGEGMAAVAAVDRRTARAGADAVVATLAELENVVGIDAALAPGAPDLHGRGWAPQNSSETSPLPNLRRGNLRGPLSVGSTRRFAARRAVARAAGSPFLVEQRWELAAQVHAAFEPHVCVADWTDDGLTVYVSTQLVSGLVSKIAKRFDLDPATVTVVAEHVGGGFGAKQWLNEETIVAIQLSRAAGRPVRVQFDRHEELEVAGYRPGARVEISLAGSDDGALPAFTTTSYADGGTSGGQLIAFFQRFAYPGSPRALLDYDVLTNAPSGRAMRAPGGPPAFAALEGAVDEYAVRLGRDPVELRRSWGAEDIVERMYDWVAAHPRWKARESPRSGRFRRGTGVAFGCWIYAFDPDTVVEVSTEPTGFRVSTGTQDIGTGSRTVIAEAVAEGLGVDVSMISVDIGRSGIWGPASAASRTTTSVHPAAAAAADAAGARLAQSAAEQLGLGGAEVVKGGLAHLGEFIPWADLLEKLDPITVSAGRPADTRRPFTPFTIEGTHFGWGLTRSAHIVEVEVDTRLGRIRPVAVEAALAAGTIHVPALARSQAHGGVIQGLGYALTEQRLLDPKTGLNITTTFDQYRILGIAGTPEVTVDFVDGGFEHSASHSAGLAEVAFAAVPAAVANAVSHALGHRFTRLPIGPADVLAALR